MANPKSAYLKHNLDIAVCLFLTTHPTIAPTNGIIIDTTIKKRIKITLFLSYLLFSLNVRKCSPHVGQSAISSSICELHFGQFFIYLITCTLHISCNYEWGNYIAFVAFLTVIDGLQNNSVGVYVDVETLINLWTDIVFHIAVLIALSHKNISEPTTPRRIT